MMKNLTYQAFLLAFLLLQRLPSTDAFATSTTVELGSFSSPKPKAMTQLSSTWTVEQPNHHLRVQALSTPDFTFADMSPAAAFFKREATGKAPLLLNFALASPILWVALKGWTSLFGQGYINVLNLHGPSSALAYGGAMNWLALNAFIALVSIPSMLTSPEKRHSRLQQMKRDLPLWSLNNVLGLLLQQVVIRVATPAKVLQSATMPSLNLFTTLGQFAVIGIVTEFLFYGFHRLQHLPGKQNFVIRYLRKIHTVHHHCGHGHDSELLPMCGGLMHPVEFMAVVGVSAIAGPLVLRASPVLHMAWYLMAYITSCIQHAGFTYADGGIHQGHHVRPNSNFGAIGLLDAVFGSYEPHHFVEKK